VGKPATDEQVLIGDPRNGGKKLKIARLMAEMTQEEVAKATGGKMFKQQVSRIESGSREKPAAADLGLLCEVYNITPNEVFEWFDYWHPRGPGEPKDERLEHLLRVVKQVPGLTRDALLDSVEAATRMAEGSVMQRTLKRERTER
jgi:transcriptional regulator with XRE-family HTH domain